MDENDTERVAHIKRLVLQVAGNVDSSRPHPALYDQLTRMVERDFAALSPAEWESVKSFVRKVSGT